MTVWIVFDAENDVEEVFETAELADRYVTERAKETQLPAHYWFIREWTVRGEDY